MKVEKGGIALVSGIWYIIVNIHCNKNNKEGSFDCICDHANNIHHWKFDDVEYFASLKEINNYNYGLASDKFNKLVRNRSIPYQVIAEVLSGNWD